MLQLSRIQAEQKDNPHRLKSESKWTLSRNNQPRREHPTLERGVERGSTKTMEFGQHSIPTGTDQCSLGHTTLHQIPPTPPQDFHKGTIAAEEETEEWDIFNEAEIDKR
jgi:hypothetical protein